MDIAAGVAGLGNNSRLVREFFRREERKENRWFGSNTLGVYSNPKWSLGK